MDPCLTQALLDELCLAFGADLNFQVGVARLQVWRAQRVNKLHIFHLKVFVDILDEEVGNGVL